MAESAVLPDRARSRAVLIGTAWFAHLPPLPAVHNNLRDLLTALTDPRIGILTPENCEIIDDPESAHTVMTRLQRAADRTDDFLLVYYAGHGLRHDRRDVLCLTLPVSDPDALDGSSVPFEWVKGVLENSHARTNLLLLDCCYSGMALGVMSGGLDRQDLEVRGTAVIASSPRNSTSQAPVGDRHTAFTGKMITLLRDGSPIPGEDLTVGTLYKRLSVALVKEEFPRPLLKITDTSGDLLVRQPTQVPSPLTTDSVPVRVLPAPPRVAAVQKVEPTPVPPPEQPTGSSTGPRQERAPDASDGSAADGLPDEPQRERRGMTKRSLQARLRTLQSFYTLTVVFLAVGLDGLVGVMVGEESTDPGSILLGGSIMTALTGVPLVLLRHRWAAVRASRPEPLLTRSVEGRVILGVCFALLMTMAISTLIDTLRVGPVSVGLPLMAAAGAAYCGHLLYRWWLPREARR